MSNIHQPNEAQPTYVLMKTAFESDAQADQGLPVAVLFRVTARDLMSLGDSPELKTRQIASLAVKKEDVRWLSGLSFTSNNDLADVPGFFSAEKDRAVFLNGIENIDEEANNGHDLYAETCKPFVGDYGNCVLRVQAGFGAENKRLYFAGDCENPQSMIVNSTNFSRLSTMFERLGNVLTQIKIVNVMPRLLSEAESKPADEATAGAQPIHPSTDRVKDTQLAAYAQAIHSSNAMLRALLEDNSLKDRKEGENTLDYINRLIQEDFARGDECLFPTALNRDHLLKNFVDLYREEDTLPADPPLGFQCDAEDGDHAQEQCENAYPGCDVVWVWQGAKGVGVDPALQDYWGNQPEDTGSDQPAA